MNTCVDCRQKLADLQILRVMQRRPAPRPIQWRPILAAGLVGRALDLMRPDDVVSRLRRFVMDRIPSRHLAVAAAVPLVVTLAIFVFERGFAIGTAMRQRTSSTPLAMTSGPPTPPPPVLSTEPITPTQPPPSLPPRPASSPAPGARAQAPSPLERAKAVDTKVAEAKVPEAKTPRSQKSASAAKQEKPTPTAPAKPAPAIAAPATAPTKAEAKTTDSVAAAPEGRRSTVDVIGRLQVKSRSEAERDLTALLARAGGTSVSRQRGPTVTVVEASVPHASYGQFAQGVGRIGSWRIEAERSPLPERVQVSVRLAE